MRRRIAAAGERYQAFHEIGRLHRDGQRIPPQLIRRGGDLSERGAAQQMPRQLLKRLVHHRGANAVSPSSPVEMTRRREGGSTDLFRIQTERSTLGRVLSLGQR